MTSVDLNHRPALAPHVRMKIDPVSGDPVLLFPEGLLILNSTAQAIVELCDGHRSGHEILTALGAQYEVDPDTLQADVLECLADLLRRNLLLFQP